MTIQELIDELNKYKDKDMEVKLDLEDVELSYSRFGNGYNIILMTEGAEYSETIRDLEEELEDVEEERGTLEDLVDDITVIAESVPKERTATKAIEEILKLL